MKVPLQRPHFSGGPERTEWPLTDQAREILRLWAEAQGPSVEPIGTQMARVKAEREAKVQRGPR